MESGVEVIMEKCLDYFIQINSWVGNVATPCCGVDEMKNKIFMSIYFGLFKSPCMLKERGFIEN